MRTTFKPISRICARSRSSLFAVTEIVAFGVRLERPVGDAFDEKFLLPFEEELRHSANARNAGKASLVMQANSY